MKLAFITPTLFIEKYGNQGDFHLALSHLIDLKSPNEYEKELKKSRLPIILDNGLFENHIAEPTDTLIRKAERIKATHVFAPDVLYDSKGTQKELDNFIKVKKNLKSKIKIAAVVQAKNPKDYMRQLLEFNKNKNVDLIGLSILSIPKSYEKLIGKFDITESRLCLLQDMIAEADGRPFFWKKCHLLGLGDSYEDVIYANENCPWVVSNDTSSCFWNGVQGKKLIGENCRVQGGKTEVKVDFNFSKRLTGLQEGIIKGNINKIKSCLK